MVGRPTSNTAPPVMGGRSAWMGSWQLWIMLLGVMAAPLLWWQEPHGQLFYPQCWLYAHTGLQCPGCGGLRCVHALLHGNLAEAWHYNPLVILYAPIVAWWTLSEVAGLAKGRIYAHPFRSGRFWIATGFVWGVFGLARNWSHFF